jgi:N-hydroxyarylamine O-acetyltransferase
MIAPVTRDAYLRRLQLGAEAPSVDALARLHRAQVEHVPYETTWLHLGEPWSVDAMASVQRIAHGGRGGYCFHVNGAFSELLTALGYVVTRHVGGVHDDAESPAATLGNHLVLVVHELPADVNPDGHWLVDAGLGDGLHEPIPLRPGEYQQGPFRFRLTTAPSGGWHLDHDALGSFAGVAIEPEPVEMDRFADRHHFLSTSPESSFARTATVQRRHAEGVDILRGLVLSEIRAGGVTKAVVEDRDEWFALVGTLGVRLRIPDAARDRLWAKVCDAHAGWAGDGAAA